MESEHTHEFERLRRQAMEDLTRLEGGLETAIAWEREQCAKAADRYGDHHSADGRLIHSVVAQHIAAIIRARSYE